MGFRSIKEIFVVGHGPSSSHTMGPYFATQYIINKYKEKGIKKLNGIIVACGSNFPDALAASYLSKSKVWPLFQESIAQFVRYNLLKHRSRGYRPGGHGDGYRENE